MNAVRAAMLLLVLLTSACGPRGQRAVESEEPAKAVVPSPDALPMPALTGSGTITLADFRGKVTLVFFFAAGLDGATDSIGKLNALQAALAAKPFTVVGVAMDLKPPVYVASELRSGMPVFPCAVAGRDARQVFATVKALPTCWLLDREGRTVRVYEGTTDVEVMRKDLEGLLP